MKKITYQHFTSKVRELMYCFIRLSAFLVILQNTSYADNNKDPRPNFVFFLVDDLGWKDIGVYGSDFYQTPNIDKLSGDAILFTDGYAACTVCSPSRASIMTGKYPAKLHLTDWIQGWKHPDPKLKIPDWTMHLPLEETTMAELFKTAGYKTGHIGKWHLGEDEMYWPENHGFDINIGGWSKGAPNNNKKEGYNGYFPPFGNPMLEDKLGDTQLTERLASEALHFIEENQNEPFFLNFWFYDVHSPIQASQEKIEKYEKLRSPSAYQQNPIYAAMVERMDEAVGMVIQKLKDLDLYENTIIVFTSDNGGLIGNPRKPITNNYPLKLGKGHMYEGGVRVPWIVKLKENTNSGTVASTPVIFPDFLPTLMSLADIQVHDSIKQDWDGIDLSPLLKGTGQLEERNSIFWHYPHYHSQGGTPYTAIRKGDWKLIHIMEEESYELYNLKGDIGEKKDLSKVYPEVLSTLKLDIQDWRLKMNAQMPSGHFADQPNKSK